MAFFLLGSFFGLGCAGPPLSNSAALGVRVSTTRLRVALFPASLPLAEVFVDNSVNLPPQHTKLLYGDL